MLEVFGDMHGLGEIEFGHESGPGEIAESTTSEDHEGRAGNVTILIDTCTCSTHQTNDFIDADRKRKAEIQKEVDRQRADRKKPKMDIAGGLENLGKTLAEGLVAAAVAATDRHLPAEGLAQVLAAVQKTQETIAQSQAQNHDVNIAILAYLKRQAEKGSQQ